MNKYFLIFAIVILTFGIYLHSTQLKQYDEETNVIDEFYPTTWLVRDSVQTTYKGSEDPSKTVDETKE